MEVDYYSKYLKYKSKYLELKAQLGGKCDDFNWFRCNDLDICQAEKSSAISGDCNYFKKKTKCDTEGCDHEKINHNVKKGQYTSCTGKITVNNKEKKCQCKSYTQSLKCSNCDTLFNNHKYTKYIECPKKKDWSWGGD